MIVWEWIVPAEVAERQKEWEQCVRLLRANQSGAKHHELADRLGVSRQTITQLISRAKNEESPVVKYMRQPLFVVNK